MNITILQPQPFDLVGGAIMIAGNAVGFEGHLSVNVSEGHGEVTGSASAGAASIRQFQASSLFRTRRRSSSTGCLSRFRTIQGAARRPSRRRPCQCFSAR